MAAVNPTVIALAVTIYLASGLRAELPGTSWTTGEESEGWVNDAGRWREQTSYDGVATEMHWSAPSGTHGTVDVPIVDLGLAGSAGARQTEDELLYSTVVQIPGERGQDQGYALGYRTNATIDHYRWVYVGTDGHTATMQILNGGLGFRYIAMSLRSQDGHGIYYNISIYGRYDVQLKAEQ